VLDPSRLSTLLGQLAIQWPSSRGIGHLPVEPTVDNSASQRVLERNGLRAEGVLRAYYEVNGVWTDMVMFALAPGHRRTNATAEPCHNAG
jgi:RimJ/RimL family protein N-acetyltransferase